MSSTKKTAQTLLAASLLGSGVLAGAENTSDSRRIKVSSPTSCISEYRQLAVLAKELGATHLGADQIEPSMWQWNLDRNDPYPNWSIQRPSLFKYVVPEKLKAYLPADYAKRNLETLIQRVKIMKEFGFRAAFNGMEPAYLPEQAYREHPEWRGPRCDHPRRARKEYYAPCLDNPEMRQIYVDAVAELCRVAPFESFELMTNDSGGGLCWYPNLYPGVNGPAACYFIPMADRIINFLSLFQEGAEKAGLKNVEVNLSRYISRDIAEMTLPKLKKNQAVCGKTSVGGRSSVTIGYMSVHREHTFPLHGLTRMDKIAEQLQAAQQHPQENLNIVLRGLDEFDTILFLKKFLHKPIASGLAGKYAALTEFAGDLVGKEHADELVCAWSDIERALDTMEPFETGGHLFMLGTVHQRWLTRPLVCFPGELKPEEKQYYRQFQFQAQSETEADNLTDLQGHRWVSGYSGSYLYRKAYAGSAPRLQKASEALTRLIPFASDQNVAKYLELQSKKVQL